MALEMCWIVTAVGWIFSGSLITTWPWDPGKAQQLPGLTSGWNQKSIQINGTKATHRTYTCRQWEAQTLRWSVLWVFLWLMILFNSICLFSVRKTLILCNNTKRRSNLKRLYYRSRENWFFHSHLLLLTLTYWYLVPLLFKYFFWETPSQNQPFCNKRWLHHNKYISHFSPYIWIEEPRLIFKSDQKSFKT